MLKSRQVYSFFKQTLTMYQNDPKIGRFCWPTQKPLCLHLSLKYVWANSWILVLQKYCYGRSGIVALDAVFLLGNSENLRNGLCFSSSTSFFLSATSQCVKKVSMNQQKRIKTVGSLDPSGLAHSDLSSDWFLAKIAHWYSALVDLQQWQKCTMAVSVAAFASFFSPENESLLLSTFVVFSPL